MSRTRNTAHADISGPFVSSLSLRSENEPNPIILDTVRALLPSGTPEREGFALYSYLVFERTPNSTTGMKYLAALAQIFNILPPYDPSEPETQPKRILLNVTYVPTTSDNRTWRTPVTLLQDYDYARARGIAYKIDADLTGGPYIVSCARPLNAQTPEGLNVIIHDLRAVTPRVVGLWVEEYLRFSRSRELVRAFAEGELKKERVRNLLLLTRSYIATAAESWRPLVNGLTDGSEQVALEFDNFIYSANLAD